MVDMDVGLSVIFLAEVHECAREQGSNRCRGALSNISILPIILPLYIIIFNQPIDIPLNSIMPTLSWRLRDRKVDVHQN